MGQWNETQVQLLRRGHLPHGSSEARLVRTTQASTASLVHSYCSQTHQFVQRQGASHLHNTGTHTIRAKPSEWNGSLSICFLMRLELLRFPIGNDPELELCG